MGHHGHSCRRRCTVPSITPGKPSISKDILRISAVSADLKLAAPRMTITDLWTFSQHGPCVYDSHGTFWQHHTS